MSNISLPQRLYIREMTTASIPPGLSELLEQFAVTVLREKPTDLVDFAAQYFTNLKDQRTTTSQRAAPTEDQMESDTFVADTAGREMEITTQHGMTPSLFVCHFSSFLFFRVR